MIGLPVVRIHNQDVQLVTDEDILSLKIEEISLEYDDTLKKLFLESHFLRYLLCDGFCQLTPKQLYSLV